jgi:hypothetical protein
MDEIRCQKAFRGLPGGLWHIFEHAHQMPGDQANPQRAGFTPCVANLNP